MKIKVLGLLKQFEKISFTKYVWSESSANISLLSLTAHCITNKFEIMTIIHKCERLEGRYTDDIIVNKSNILKDWGLSSKSVEYVLRYRGYEYRQFD